MLATKYLIDTNILIYHTQGSRVALDILDKAIAKKSFNISILTKIEFLGWNKHTSDGLIKCKKLIEAANIYPLDDEIANKTIELRINVNIKFADAVIASTTILNNLTLITRNINDFKKIDKIDVINPFEDTI